MVDRFDLLNYRFRFRFRYFIQTQFLGSSIISQSVVMCMDEFCNELQELHTKLSINIKHQHFTFFTWNNRIECDRVQKFHANASGKFSGCRMKYFFFFIFTSNYPLFKRFNETTIIANPKIQSFESTFQWFWFAHEHRITKNLHFEWTEQNRTE